MRNGATPDDFRTASDFHDASAGFPIPAFVSALAGAHCSPTTFAIAIPQGDDGFNPVSLVCKLSDVDGRPAVKLSDNYSKAMGDANEAERYRRVFGVAGVTDTPVLT